ncbi:response regulator transcription factor [Geobacter sulfurreducens]|uniref:Helix-turn-helix transcriptional response regulator, LuxR family n=1 Tax=Geobacter sulfurreducens (strain ATCC 51573 / DSM 12127 / PCA) TaxID=243231 RepID=Q74GJ2_GEOSL|nr:response regulator transcription factor [Geobacter sulfurreducens]AAR33588.1 helix-turn-helix transcriptional response regulator, LuxR family [Geobacter sulfurreducens PCA]AJY69983.1 LuxR family transcriptional regulator [Geobacter sulfurreducens]HBB68360.1 DNA-binding response regulator [Geobacter sulfurreducens]HCD97461.1 DNA-binding response regulator [Geobacter sulfurreducens]
MVIKVLIADDHAVVRDGLTMILESQSDIAVIGQAGDGREAIAMAESLKPNVVVMDITMPELNGIEAARLIAREQPATKIVILSMHDTLEHVYRALQAGARGYLLKESAGAEVTDAVRTVMRGHRYFGRGSRLPSDMHRSACADLPKSPLDSLSQREREVLQLVVEGKKSSEIAEILSLSPKSIETYRSRLMIKLGITNIPSLVKFALLHGVTPAK